MKLSRIIAVFGVLWSSATIANHPWRTNDQQAAKLFSQNKMPEAAAQFDDPAWKAAAQFKAGQYQQTIKTLAGLPKTCDNYYNLGNALAHAGQYQQAIDAYNQALKQSPNDQDVTFNKKIVMSLLKKQQQNQQTNSSSSDKANKQPSDDHAAIDNQQQANQPTTEQAKPSASEGRSLANPNTADQHDASENKQQDGEPAQLDANNTNTDPSSKLTAAEGKTTQPSERAQSLAHQQQLRRVPDNPGKLLQQKLQRDYLNRHPEQQRW